MQNVKWETAELERMIELSILSRKEKLENSQKTYTFF